MLSLISFGVVPPAADARILVSEIGSHDAFRDARGGVRSVI